jgi:hypothetical protein
VTIHFFTLKWVKSRAIHTQIASVCCPEAHALPTVKKRRRRFHQGRTDLFHDPRSGRPLTNDLMDAIGSELEKELFSSCKIIYHHCRIGKATFLRILHDELGLKISIFAGCRMPDRLIRIAKECDI